MKIKTYSYLISLSVPVRVIYETKNSPAFYYIDREELIEFLLENDFEVKYFLENSLGVVRSMWDGESDDVGLYITDVENAFQNYYSAKGKSLFPR